MFRSQSLRDNCLADHDRDELFRTFGVGNEGVKTLERGEKEEMVYDYKEDGRTNKVYAGVHCGYGRARSSP